jgi:putative MATE family efflux protein
VLQVVLIYGFDQGIGASALSTVVAQTAGAAVYVWRVAGPAQRLGAALRPDPASLRRLAVVGRDLLLRTAALRVALVVGTAVATRIGTDDLAAYEISFQVWTFLAYTLDAVAIAGQAIVGRALGAGHADDARASGKRMIEIGVVLGVAIALVVLAARTALPHLFTDDHTVIGLAAFTLIWVAVLQPVNAVAFVLDGVLIGAGDMRFLAWAMAIASALFVAGATAVVALDLGLGYLWAALGLLMTARAALLSWRFTGNRWIVLGATR